MKLVSSVTEELENIRRYAALLTDNQLTEEPARNDKVQQLLNALSIEINSTRADIDRENDAQPYLGACHVDLAWAWDEVAHVARLTRPPAPLDKIREPLITVAPIGSFNATSVRDVAGNTALVFDASLIGALYIVALHCGRVFSDWVESYVAQDMDRFSTGIKDVSAIQELHGILSSLVAHGCVAPDVILDCVSHLDGQSYKLGLTIYFRLVQFLVGHEFSHFLYDHHLFDVTKAEERDSPLFEFLRESLDRRFAYYADDLREAGEEQRRNFLFDQFHEYQADEQSMTFLGISGRYSNKDPHKRRLFVIDIAAVAAYFMISIAIERMVFIRIRGKDPVTSPLYSDFGVLNLCLYKSHPSPLSRLSWIKEWMNAHYFGGDEAAHSFSGPVEDYFNYAIGLDRGMRKYIRFEPQTVAKKWASRHSNSALLSIMWPGETVPNLCEWLAQLDVKSCERSIP